MAKNVVGLFDTMNDAEAAVRDLRDAGFNSGDISLVANNSDNSDNLNDTSYDSTATETEAGEGVGIGATGGAVLGGLAGLGALVIPGIGPVVAAGTLATALGSATLGAGLGVAAGGLVGALVGAGIPEEDAHVYSEGIRRGGALVSVQVDTDDDADRAANIMDSHNIVDIDERGSTYRQGGWSRFDENAGPYSSKGGPAGGGLAGAATSAAGGPVGAVGAAGAKATDNNANRTDYTTTNTGMSSTNLDQGGEVKIPIVEEELRVGKREVEQGGVRVNTRVEETPVNEQVTLREETVDVHRKPVDRPVSDADVANFQEGTFEVRERAEEVIVDKQARVVEEVYIKKNVEERTENIQDTVRRTDVDVDQLGNERTTTSSGSHDTTSHSEHPGAPDVGPRSEHPGEPDVDPRLGWSSGSERDSRNNY